MADLFDSILTLDEHSINAGVQEGRRDGRKQGYVDGMDLGWKYGFDLGKELGMYNGCLEVWSDQVDQLSRFDGSWSKSRVSAAHRSIKQIRDLLQTFPRYNNPEEDMDARLRKIRTTFRQLAGKLGMPVVQLDGDASTDDITGASSDASGGVEPTTNTMGRLMVPDF